MKIERIAIILTVICATLICTNDSARILGLFPFQGKSHFIMFEALMKALAEKGHTVDVLSHFPLKKPMPRYNDLSVKGILPIYVNNLTYEEIEGFNTIVGTTFIFTEAGTVLCEKILNTSVTRNLKHSDVKYDLVITEVFGTDCFLGFAHHFKVPTVAMISSTILPSFTDRFGIPDNPSYIPNYYLHSDEKMTLYQRIVNLVFIVSFKLGYQYMSMRPSDKIAREFFGADMPPLETLANNMSLILMNSFFGINTARPLPPNAIEVGGLHISTPKPVTGDLGKFLNDSKQGVIYFSMGSMVRTESFSKDKQRALIESFGKLPYQVLWKAERDKFPGPIPDNIRFETWMPQLDILCHPNTKLFITHGGMMGAHEAVYCGVPILGIPMFADQLANTYTFAQRGVGIQILYEDITKDSVLSALKSLLESPKYSDKAKQFSAIFRDRPLSPMEAAVYWVEYVIRHAGAPQLRSNGANLPWYQYLLFDVIFVLISVFVVVLYSIYYFTSVLIKILMKKSEKLKTS